MGAKVIVWWVDDDFLRDDADSAVVRDILNKDRHIHVRGIAPFEFVDELEADADGPDLFLVDYRLNENRDPNRGRKFPFTGTGLVGAIRDKFPEHPIYLVSRIIGEEHLDEENDLFDRLMTHASLKDRRGSGKKILVFDGDDYRSIRKIKDKRSSAPLLRLIKPPKGERGVVEEAIPHSVRSGLGASRRSASYSDTLSGTIRFAQWVRRVFLKFPGLLYDDLFAATFLGMNPRYFTRIFADKRAVRRRKLEYTGLFSRTAERRWWKAALSNFVLELATQSREPFGNPWEIAPKLLKLSKSHMARCAICNQLYPETVAYDPDDPGVWEQVHWRCSTIDQSHQPGTHFEQFRTFKR